MRNREVAAFALYRGAFRRSARAGVAPLGAALLGVALLACFSDRPSVGPEPPADGSDVAIRNFAYVPPAISVVAGTVVTWTNDDEAPHTVTADDGESFESTILDLGGTFELTAQAPGTYQYHCEVHPFMTGTLEVTAE